LPHLPRVVIRTPIATPEHPAVPVVLTDITIDGRRWYVTGYKVEGEVKGEQRVTLTFLADVTIEHGR
jgi:hypothetical protein